MFYKIVPVSSLNYYLSKDECISTVPRLSKDGTKVLLRFNRKISASYISLDEIKQTLQGADWKSIGAD